jgi:hypothetical protein
MMTGTRVVLMTGIGIVDGDGKNRWEGNGEARDISITSGSVIFLNIVLYFFVPSRPNRYIYSYWSQLLCRSDATESWAGVGLAIAVESEAVPL